MPLSASCGRSGDPSERLVKGWEIAMVDARELTFAGVRSEPCAESGFATVENLTRCSRILFCGAPAAALSFSQVSGLLNP